MVYGWLHIIVSKETYEKLWNAIGKFRELYLGSFVIIDGSLTCKDNRVIGNEGKIMAGITTITFEKETMEKIFESKIIDPLMTILIDDLAPEEMIMDDDSESVIKKVIKSFEKPSEFKNYLRKIGIEI